MVFLPARQASWKEDSGMKQQGNVKDEVLTKSVSEFRCRCTQEMPWQWRTHFFSWVSGYTIFSFIMHTMKDIYGQVPSRYPEWTEFAKLVFSCTWTGGLTKWRGNDTIPLPGWLIKYAALGANRNKFNRPVALYLYDQQKRSGLSRARDIGSAHRWMGHACTMPWIEGDGGDVFLMRRCARLDQEESDAAGRFWPAPGWTAATRCWMIAGPARMISFNAGWWACWAVQLNWGRPDVSLERVGSDESCACNDRSGRLCSEEQTITRGVLSLTRKWWLTAI